MSFLRYFRLTPRSNRVFRFSLPEDTDPYSTAESTTISTWVDGRTIYRKVIPFAHGPNVIQLSIPHGISPAPDVMKDIYGAMKGPGGDYIPLPFISDSLDFSPNDCIALKADATNVYITPLNGMGTDWSAWSGFVVLEYVK